MPGIEEALDSRNILSSTALDPKINFAITNTYIYKGMLNSVSGMPKTAVDPNTYNPKQYKYVKQWITVTINIKITK